MVRRTRPMLRKVIPMRRTLEWMHCGCGRFWIDARSKDSMWLNFCGHYLTVLQCLEADAQCMDLDDLPCMLYKFAGPNGLSGLIWLQIEYFDGNF
uniref:Uncharacterized protein n=1 Tax=Arundo donax TaxID=35708 RepID=A0A0A9EYH3_ARUDO